MTIPFFEKTGSKWPAFSNLWLDESISENKKNFLLLLLIDQDIIINFVTDFSEKKLLPSDVQKMYSLITWNLDSISTEMEDIFIDKVSQQSEIILERPVKKDWNKIYNEREQKSWDLLFDKDKFLDEIELIFSIVKKECLQHNDVIEIRKDNWLPENKLYFQQSTLNLLRDFTTNNRSIQLKNIKDFLKILKELMNFKSRKFIKF
jgi:hypothetical protein